MERVLEEKWDLDCWIEWQRAVDGKTLKLEALEGVSLFDWRIKSANPWWNRPLRMGEIACALSHLRCWERAADSGTELAVILEDDVELSLELASRLKVGIDQLGEYDSSWGIVYLGRMPLESDRPACNGLVVPGYSHCTFGYAVSRAGA